MQIARDRDNTTLLHLVSATWSPEQDIPAMGSLCRTHAWCFTDSPIGRDDLFCGRCLNVWQSLVDELPDSDHGADAKSYPAYLQTRHWRHTRKLALEHYGERCTLCGSEDGLDVHHRTYERRGRERLSDLTVLCRDCHSSFHEAA